MSEKKKISNAKLVLGKSITQLMLEELPKGNKTLVLNKSIAQFVIEQLLDGIEVQVDVDGEPCSGKISSLNLTHCKDCAFADVYIDDSKHYPSNIHLNVAIYRDGRVSDLQTQDRDVEILPIQEE